jgi:hypothetical protein
MSEQVLQAKNICAYGCGREALHSLKMKGGGWKFCCSPHYQQCPAQRLKRGIITRAVHTRQRLDGTVLRRHMLIQYKRQSVDRGIKWTITDNHFYSLIRGLCYYCGHQPTAMQQFNGVDRFEESLGYTPQNSVPCCEKCAVMKLELSTEELSTQVKHIHDRHPAGILHPSKAVITKSA